jgi:hypothetical protein
MRNPMSLVRTSPLMMSAGRRLGAVALALLLLWLAVAWAIA